jgi:hypothetical protein
MPTEFFPEFLLHFQEGNSCRPREYRALREGMRIIPRIRDFLIDFVRKPHAPRARARTRAARKKNTPDHVPYRNSLYIAAVYRIRWLVARELDGLFAS